MTSHRFSIIACAITAGFAVHAADLAASDAAPAGTEPGELTFAEGVHEGERVRVVAGELDGRGVLYAEHYTGAALRYAVPYTRVFIDGEVTSPRTLQDLVVAPQQTPDGFAFTAMQGSTPLQCTALMWGDATANCTRNPSWVPPGDPACRVFKSHDERFQCNGLRAHFTTPAIPHDELLQACTKSFRGEIHRMGCIRYGYNNVPSRFHDVRATCTAAFAGEDARNFCFFFSLAYVTEAERVPPATVRACDRLFGDDAATTECVFRTFTGGRPEGPRDPKKPPPKNPDPMHYPTAPLQLAVSSGGARATGARIAVSTGTWEGLSLRATGGMVGSEPIVFVDAHANGEHRWMQPLDRLVIGRSVRALREATDVDRVKLQGSILTFRATVAGQRLTCRADATQMYARCR